MIREAERLDKVKARLFKLGITQNELAKEIGVSPPIFSMMMMGRVVMTPEEREKVAKRLRMNVSDLFG